MLAAPLTKEDLEFEVHDQTFLADFEAAWVRFLKGHPELIPKGSREGRIVELQLKAREVEESKLDVLKEMERQVDRFKETCEALEDEYATKMQEAIEKQKHVHDELQKRLDDVAIADHLQQQTLPWHHFIHELDQAALVEEATENGSTGSSRGARPSSRAMVLTDSTRGCSADISLRAYTMDHALLTNHIRVLTKEIDRYHRLIRAQELTANFLREHNAWNVLMNGGSTNDHVSE